MAICVCNSGRCEMICFEVVEVQFLTAQNTPFLCSRGLETQCYELGFCVDVRWYTAVFAVTVRTR